MKQSWVYIMSNRSWTLYIGVTSDLEGRVWQHKAKRVPGFTRRYNITMLVYAEEFAHIIPNPGGPLVTMTEGAHKGLPYGPALCRPSCTWNHNHSAGSGISDAIGREKQLKRWTRAKKIALIERDNPDWLDLMHEDTVLP